MSQQQLQQALDHHQKGEWDLADSLYKQVLEAEPNHPDALHLYGMLHHAKGESKAAAELVKKAISLSPQSPYYHYNLGNILFSEEQYEQAILSYQQAQQLNPNDPAILNNLGDTFRKVGRNKEALLCFQQALQIAPDYGFVLNNLGNLYKEMWQFEKALPFYETAIRSMPGHADFYGNYGEALCLFKKYDEAIAAFKQGLALEQKSKILSGLVYAMQHACQWEGLAEYIETLQVMVEKELQEAKGCHVQPFHTLCLPFSPDLQKRVAEQHAKQISSKMETLRSHLNFQYQQKQNKKIRIGYISGDFHDHPILHLMAGMFEHHDRQKFEVYAYALGPNDGSDYRKRMETGCDQVRDLRHEPYENIAKTIHNDQIDILVDVQGYTMLAKPEVLALRPAPVQVSFLAYPGTMGGEFVDYLVADPQTIPPEYEQHYAEKILHMPNTYFITDDQQEISEHLPSREACGLPAKGFVFCSFNRSYKITESVFQTWMEILKEIPDSVLWLFKETDVIERNLKAAASSQGIDPERLIFAKRVDGKADHLSRLKHVDLFLDTPIYNAHTTAIDALWAGVPVLTCPGETMASRACSGILTAIDMPELIARDAEDYKEKALNIAANSNECQKLRKKLTEHSKTAPLFQTELFVKDFEKMLHSLSF